VSIRLLYSKPDAAEQLSISERVLDRLLRDGEIASVLIGRRRLVPADALVDYIDRIKQAS
jgi:excisionase family DNA binding protein